MYNGRKIAVVVSWCYSGNLTIVLYKRFAVSNSVCVSTAGLLTAAVASVNNVESMTPTIQALSAVSIIATSPLSPSSLTASSSSSLSLPPAAPAAVAGSRTSPASDVVVPRVLSGGASRSRPAGTHSLLTYYDPAIAEWGIKRYRDPSVCLSQDAAALGYRHALSLQLSHVRTADPSADGRRSAASRTAVGGEGISSRLPPGR